MSQKNKPCMIHRCPNCPGTEPLEQYLKDLLLPSDLNDNEDQDEKASEFIELLVSKLDKISTHSYIAKSQTLQKTKNELGKTEVVVLGDFAENYQEEIQGFHWNKTQCTSHPIMVHYKNNGELQSHSIGYISGDIAHDVDIIYHYFSDGCAAQYKNCKNVLNLCLDFSDFSINCTWSFFATTHGKSPCGGLGGTTKRLTARTSLQCPIDRQILSVEEMFTFCEAQIDGIVCTFIKSETIVDVRQQKQKRYASAKTLPRTRSYHQFILLSHSKIGVKYVSEA